MESFGKVSVLIGVYNANETIGRTLTSVLNQSYRNFEIILIDDGSKDDSSEVILDVFNARDSRTLK